MRVSRLDLDGKGSGSPEGLVKIILDTEPDLPTPTPIEELCAAFDISEIRELKTSGFEGGLITDTERSNGIILVNRGAHRFRQRFTIAHELGHFLIPTHMPNKEGHFLCSKADMALLSPKENDRRVRMEVEANRFASLILIPPPRLRPALVEKRELNVLHMIELAQRFAVSKEAMGRAYSQYCDRSIAFLFTRHGRVLRIYKNAKFPAIVLGRDHVVPADSVLKIKPLVQGAASEISECLPSIWIDVERGKRAPLMFEQALGQKDGFAILMLTLEQFDSSDDEYDPDAERTAKQRLANRLLEFKR